MTSKERCLAVIRGQRADRVPVMPLLMFLAADRANITYRQFATDGQALAEAQVRMYHRFSVDAITACSDAFRVTADLGGRVAYPAEGTPHALEPLVRAPADLAKLPRPDPTRAGGRMADRAGAVARMARAVGGECLVLGWVDLPFAEACSVCGVQEFLLMLHEAPAFCHRLLAFLTEIVIDFCRVQLAAGAPMIGCGDAAASLVSPAMYREFALPYEQQVFGAIHAAGGLGKLHICGNTTALLADMRRSGADLFNVDHLVPLDQAGAVLGAGGHCFKGNLDPVRLLSATPAEAGALGRELIECARAWPYLLSAGCEIPPGVRDESLAAFCAAAAARGGGNRGVEL